MSQKTLSEHATIALLHRYCVPYLKGGLEKVAAKQSGTVACTGAEAYAIEIVSRVNELDMVLESIRLAQKYIQNLDTKDPDVLEHYRYHQENALLRFSGVADRAHRLVGAVFRLKPRQFDKTGGNELVASHAKSANVRIHQALAELSRFAAKYKKQRNEIAHSASYGSKDLATLRSANLLREFIDIPELENLTALMCQQTVAELGEGLLELSVSLELLLNSIEPEVKNALISLNAGRTGQRVCT